MQWNEFFFFFPVGFHCRLQNILYYSWQHLPWTGVCISLKRSQFSYRRGGPISCILGTRCCPTQYLNNEYGWKVMKNDCFMSINFFGHPACCFLGTPPSLTCTEPLLLPSNNSGAREVDTPFMAWIQPSTESGVYAFDTAVMRNSLCPQCEIPAPRTTSKSRWIGLTPQNLLLHQVSCWSLTQTQSLWCAFSPFLITVNANHPQSPCNWG